MLAPNPKYCVDCLYTMKVECERCGNFIYPGHVLWLDESKYQRKQYKGIITCISCSPNRSGQHILTTPDDPNHIKIYNLNNPAYLTTITKPYQQHLIITKPNQMIMLIYNYLTEQNIIAHQQINTYAAFHSFCHYLYVNRKIILFDDIHNITHISTTYITPLYQSTSILDMADPNYFNKIAQLVTDEA